MFSGTSDFNKRADGEFCYIGEPTISGQTITVSVQKLIFDGQFFENCEIQFDGVHYSQRRLSPYDSAGNLTGERRVIVEIDLPAEIDLNHYKLDGVFKTTDGRSGWIGWDIKGIGYSIEPK
jgi:hypothetical protein